ncbi:bifunctional diaminohydroxyphosphoribosylaminopyrimidine deaminase/5-amino-6-(5-phosphoribosylamino)uracil reductase RibD [SCandidatus Aminicenantes bacterium Aminicenantia_JdfR_composite]|jgi:diaminohydroxyphosphoribosylaminopyrimidine deaminase/5-amino-6-(5-phosphoribosylamino)uracil reductase|nr:bifunctional diaminohydroxyphosphoribosylaminopyrimidine deaminase/5-amino-6-(5-phosphoribosylamino)uracil reductase RibD [SCandidatus Aminicenantes bacterium Aminicenantia_JdfR_composite]MCP2597610.1 bifunctional diaminohydroxyphosphoribosylaminopyrimidine deaminase/5-amino-6-(5-phosphoribosylamino)uracil reductase RibD [Candidatus Aminicenantes bacterium AC-335-G13]MCP2598308.1 bifunctional diaminohydroxyphosphoribosylaminopyrimidine deaminase/5-amino-6-(5-phosphoribosylamino)uracil reductas
MSNLEDIKYLKLALFLARKGKGWTSPNPCVGAVIVKDGKIVGYGFHESAGKPHAEAVAIERAGPRASDSTLYLNLEPCVHWGRTPPCVEKIIESKIKRVVISTFDPNPLVYKKGVKKLEEKGIKVSVGLLEEESKKLNEVYFKYIKSKLPFVALKVAMSIDGKIATQSFQSKWISSKGAREYVHLLRGEFDSILVGINTILRDDPLLTVRHPLWRNKKIKRVILDSTLKIPENSKILRTISKGDIIIYTGEGSSKKKINMLEKRGIKVIPLRLKESRIPIIEVLKDLAKREITSILVEGGRKIFSSFLMEGLADKIFIFVAPIFIGGKEAPSLFEESQIKELKDVLKLKKIFYFRIDKDILIEGYF